MHKIILVDDEDLVLKGLRATIDWSLLNTEVVGTAKDGKEALVLIETLKPDLVLTDVKMPVMNGLELARELKARNFLGKVIILSGFQEFDYAKQALESQVFAFLLKPIENNKLMMTIEAAIKELETKLKESNIINFFSGGLQDNKNRVIRSIIRGEIGDEDRLKTIFPLLNLEFFDSGVLAIGKIDDFDEGMTAYLQDFLVIFSQVLAQSNLRALDGVYHNRITILINGGIMEAYQLIETCFKKWPHDEITFSFGISKPFTAFKEVRTCYEEARNIAVNEVTTSLNSILDSSNSKQFYSKNLTDALKIIHTKYSENLTIKYLADHLYVSESYIMHMFKGEMNQTFIEILTNHRLKVAKMLLKTGKYRISEVAYKIGYNDEKYFTALFKKAYQITPSKYSKLHD
ncbi:MAG: response regulator [Erysipelotrichaceae bacterium]|nr:response regulator [Erysipelotrichaceae bacterium]